VSLAVDRQLVWFWVGVLGVLVVATVVAWILKARARSEAAEATVENINARIHSWWLMVGVVALAILAGRIGAVILFALV